MKPIIKSALALSSFFALISAAQAFEATSFSSFSLREGPGAHYAQIGKVSPKQNLKIGVCNPSWCHVQVGQKTGWAPTAQINPNLARAKQSRHTSQAVSGAGGGNSPLSSTGARMQSSTTMTISMEIVAKDSANRQGKKGNRFPFPIPAHRQIRTR